MSIMKISAIFAMAALVYATAIPAANGTFTRRGLSVTGRVCCTATGNCVAGSTGVVGLPVTLNCPTSIFNIFAPVVVATATTDANGNFVLTVGATTGVIAPLCTVRFVTPATGNTCIVLATAAARTFIAGVSITSFGSILLNTPVTAVTLPFN